MVCIYCSGNTQVTNSRPQKRLNQVWRRRKCLDCGAIFSTTEAVETAQALLVKSSHSLQPFSKDLLLLSVYDSLRHRKTAINDATALTATIFGQLLQQNQQGVIERTQIVRTVTAILSRFDKAAATSYAAFHPVQPRA